MALNLYKYKVYCQTELANRYWWLDENQSIPTTCPNDTAHTVDTNQTEIVDSRKGLFIEQEIVKTGGHFKWETVAYTALPNQTTQYNCSFPYDITILSVVIHPDANNTLDLLTMRINPDANVGTVTQAITIDDTIINVSSSVSQIVKIGYKVQIQGDEGTFDCGFVIGVDTVNDTITVQNPVQIAYSVVNPTSVVMNIYLCENIEFGQAGIIDLGSEKIGGTYIPANLPLRCEYTNLSNSPKRFVSNVKYLY